MVSGEIGVGEKNVGVVVVVAEYEIDCADGFEDYAKLLAYDCLRTLVNLLNYCYFHYYLLSSVLNLKL